MTSFNRDKQADHAYTQKSPETNKYADFRDDAMFPSFAALPDKNELDLNFYESNNGSFYHPSKH